MVSLLLTLFATAVFVFGFLGLGHAVLGYVKNSFTALEKLIISAFLGMNIGVSVLVFFAFLIGPLAYWLVWLFVLIGVVHRKPLLAEIRTVLAAVSKNKLYFIFGLLATISLASTVFLGGFRWQGNTYYQEIHDSLWHVSLIQQLLVSFPPQHPAFPEIVLQNYHYFYDVFLAALHTSTGAPVQMLYFQFGPLLLAGMLMSSAWLLGRRLLNQFGGVLLLFLTAFTGSFAYLIPLFLPEQTWGESSFWVSQTFIMMVNPQIIFSLGLVYVFLLIISATKHLSWHKHLLLIALLAPSIGFKSYSWVVLSVVYAMVLAWELLVDKQTKSVFIGLLYTVLSLPFVWIITKFKGGGFFYEPLWYLNSMVESPDRLNYIPWKLLEDHYRLKGNWPRVWEIKIKELLIFYFGNLGIRGLMLLTLPLTVFKKFSIKHTKVIVFAWVGFLFSSIFPLLFLQSGIVWNSIQFWYYALVFANVLAAFAITWLLSKFGTVERVIVIALLIALALPTYAQAVSQKFMGMQSIPETQTAWLNSLSNADHLLVCPEDSQLYKSQLLAALTEATVYLSDPVQLELVAADLSAEVELQTIFKNNDVEQLKKLLKEKDISHLVCTDKGRIGFIEQSLELEATQYQDWSVFPIK